MLQSKLKANVIETKPLKGSLAVTNWSQHTRVLSDYTPPDPKQRMKPFSPALFGHLLSFSPFVHNNLGHYITKKKKPLVGVSVGSI